MIEVLQVIFVAALPVSELRGAVPLGIGVFGLSVWETYIWAVIGNMIPVFFLLWFLPAISKFMIKKWDFADRFFSWIFERTRKRTEAKINKYGAPALILFVAIPLPFTGAWTGSIAAFLFGIKARRALPLIFLGVLIAGGLVTLATTGFVMFFK
ncbi:small multi-drug export protein [Candidatus Falkowbacteria bacterium]|nr:small multi-drug export protein [Candidatus Falkowbacteria bacterium]